MRKRLFKQKEVILEKGKSPKFRLQKGDQVVVISGKERGNCGTIIAVNNQRRLVYIDNVVTLKRRKKTKSKKDSYYMEKPLRVEKVALCCQKHKGEKKRGLDLRGEKHLPSRIKITFKRSETGELKKERLAKKTRKLI